MEAGANYWSLFRYALTSMTVMWLIIIEYFHMTSRRPYWCPKTMKRRPCWCPKPVPWELNSFLMQTLSFVTINLHICWPREWKRSISRNNYKLHDYHACKYIPKAQQKNPDHRAVSQNILQQYQLQLFEARLSTTSRSRTLRALNGLDACCYNHTVRVVWEKIS